MESQSRSPHSLGSPSSPAVAGLCDGDLELEALERMLLALAVHPGGGGAPRAWLLLWNARTGRMEGWRGSRPCAPGSDLARAIGDARRAAPGEEEREVVAWSEEPEGLEPLLADAWRNSALAVGHSVPGMPWSGQGGIAALALRRGPRAYGLLVLAEPGAAEDPARRQQLEWLHQTVNVSLGANARSDEARRRARQAEALAEFSRTCVSSINLAEAVHLLARLAAQATGVRGSAVYRAAGDGALRVEVAFGPATLRDRFAEGWSETARRALASGHPRFGGPSDAPADVPPGMAGETSVWAALPVAAYGRALGALVVWDGLERHPVSPALERDEEVFLAALADAAALLLAHGESLESLRRSERQRAEQATRLYELDRLVAVGDMAARVARESRNPIASISAFAKRARRELAEDDPQHEYLEIVIRETERLEAMLQEQLEYARLERSRLRMQSLNAVVQEALQRWSETLVRRRVRLLKRLAPELPELLLDAHRIRRVVENVVAFALESVPMGGRIKVETRRAGGHVAVEIAHDGTRSAGDLLEQLFVPFSSGASGGAAVGLGVAQQIVREHGGEIRVRGEGEWGTVFSFTLPVAGNEDRRRARDRRSVRGERRRADDEGDGGEGGGG